MGVVRHGVILTNLRQLLDSLSLDTGVAGAIRQPGKEIMSRVEIMAIAIWTAQHSPRVHPHMPPEKCLLRTATNPTRRFPRVGNT